MSSSISGLRPAPILLLLATALFCVQLLTGTSLSFAGAVLVIFVLVIVTLRTIGFAGVAGLQIVNMAFCYLVLSQILKAWSGEPADSNLGAPETTIVVLLVGFGSICAAAILAGKMLNGQAIIRVAPSARALSIWRDLALAVAVVSFVIVRYYGTTENGEAVVGGWVAFARHVAVVGYFAITAETWRALRSSGGVRSTSLALYLILGYFIWVGFLADSKEWVATPFLVYLIAAAGYRFRVTRAQVAAVVSAAALGVLVVYPAIHVLRSERGPGGLTASQVFAYLARAVEAPTRLARDWQAYRQSADFDTGAYAASLEYLGYFDDLVGRFVLIANTDSIVSMVDLDGVYGPDAIFDGLQAAVPTFLDRDKPRVSAADELTWFYGLREGDVIGAPTIGIFADSYAALGWVGVVVIPFAISLVLFLELQLTGTRIGGNMIGGFLVAISLHGFVECNISSGIWLVLRSVPTTLGLLLVLLAAANSIARRNPAQFGPIAVALDRPEGETPEP